MPAAGSTKWNASSATSPAWHAARRCRPRNSRKQTSFFLPNSIFLQTITGEWADNPSGAFTEPDMILVPDFSTATAAPWTADVTLQVIHDAQDQQGSPVPTAPRNVLRRIVELYNAEGWQPVVAPEMEFFLTARNLDPNMPVMPPMGRSGRRAAGKQAYSMSAVDEYGKVIDDIYDFAEAQGFEIDGILQEGGAGQVEINLAHGDPVRLADEIFFFKRLIREAALRHDCFATFMAKPIEGEPGRAMHIHHSVVDVKIGQEHLLGQEGQRNRAFLHFIAGMQNHLPAGRRAAGALRQQLPPLRPGLRGTDQPGMGPRQPHDRSARADLGTRGAAAGKPAGGDGLQPLSRPRRVARLRLSGPEGGQEAAPGMHGGCLQHRNAICPTTWAMRLTCWRRTPRCSRCWGRSSARSTTVVKRNEYKEFLQVISPWEREHLLLNV